MLYISVVLPTYERLAILRRCLDRLAAQSVPLDDFEVLVVDDASREPVAPSLEPIYRDGPLQVRWLRVEPNNPARARNVGLDEARGWLVLFLGDDVLALPNLLEEHLAVHRRTPDSAACLCRLETDPELLDTPFQRFFDPFGFSRLRGDQELGPRYFWTNNVSLKTAFLRTHGRFDEEFPDANHEDIELGYRLHRRGMRLHYRDRLVGYHHHRYTLDSACRLLYRRGETYHVLRAKVPDAVFRESLGIFSWRSRPRAVARGLARAALFNDLTAPAWKRWLERDRESWLRRALYWKLLTYHTNKGFRDARPKRRGGLRPAEAAG